MVSRKKKIKNVKANLEKTLKAFKSVPEETKLKTAGVVLGSLGAYTIGQKINSATNDEVMLESFADVKNHVYNNRLKYAAGGAVGGAYGLTKGVSSGVFGVGPQDAAQKFFGKHSADMLGDAVYNNQKSAMDAKLEVYKRPDNWFGDRSREEAIQNFYQKENIPEIGNYVGSKVFQHLGNLDSDQDKQDFIIRNPGLALAKTFVIPYKYKKGATDSIVEKAFPVTENTVTLKFNLKNILLECYNRG